jgi:hypothetical protein
MKSVARGLDLDGVRFPSSMTYVRHWTYIGGGDRGERNPTLLVITDLAKALGVPLKEAIS